MLVVNGASVGKTLVSNAVAFLAKKKTGLELQQVLSKYSQAEIDQAFNLAARLYGLGYTSFASVYFSQWSKWDLSVVACDGLTVEFRQ